MLNSFRTYFMSPVLMFSLGFAFFVFNFSGILFGIEGASKDSPTVNNEDKAIDITPVNFLPKNFSKPLKIFVTFMVNKIQKIEESNGSFEATIDVNLRWHDPNTVFNPKTFGMDRKVLSFEQATDALNKIWNPQIVIPNIIDKPIRIEPWLIIHSDGTVEYIQRIKARFENIYQLSAFPFDTQQLSIRLLSNRYNTSEIQFIQNQQDVNHSGIRESAGVDGWSLVRVDYSISSIRGLDGHFFPQFQADIVVKRLPVSHLLYFFPLLLIVIVPTILTLFANTDENARLGAWSGAILSLIALSFTLTLRYPALPSNSLLSQIITAIFIYEFIMICLTLTLLSPRILSITTNPYLVSESIRYLRWVIPFGFLFVIFVRALMIILV